MVHTGSEGVRRTGTQRTSEGTSPRSRKTSDCGGRMSLCLAKQQRKWRDWCSRGPEKDSLRRQDPPSDLRGPGPAWGPTLTTHTDFPPLHRAEISRPDQGPPGPPCPFDLRRNFAVLLCSVLLDVYDSHAGPKSGGREAARREAGGKREFLDV